MILLHKFDLFKRDPTLTIKRQDSISIIETIFFSLIFYCLGFAILMYNFLDVYLQNKPIVQQSEEIRNINSFEIIDSSKLKFGISANNIKFSLEDVTLELLSLKDARILGIPVNNNNGNAELSIIPKFSAKSTINSQIKIGCSYLEGYNNKLSTKNTICTEYFDKNITLGGSAFSGGTLFSQFAELNIDFCNFFNLLDPTNDPNSILNFIKMTFHN